MHNSSGFGAVRLAHRVWDAGAVGSNPATPTKLYKDNLLNLVGCLFFCFTYSALGITILIYFLSKKIRYATLETTQCYIESCGAKNSSVCDFSWFCLINEPNFWLVRSF